MQTVSPTAAATPAEVPENQDPGDSGEQADLAAEFAGCQQTFNSLVSSPDATAKVTPQQLEQWQDAFRDASALNAEGDYSGAVGACNSLVAEVRTALG